MFKIPANAGSFCKKKKKLKPGTEKSEKKKTKRHASSHSHSELHTFCDEDTLAWSCSNLEPIENPLDNTERLHVHHSLEENLQFEAICKADSSASLQTLVLVGQPATSLKGLNNLNHLVELWLVESQIEDARAARQCTLLEKLFLYSNKLVEIPDLSLLNRLHTFWLSGNYITEIKNVNTLCSLQTLNLADNLIHRIGSGLKGCKRLTTLNLSGNPISHLEEFYTTKARYMSMLRRHSEAQYLLAVRELRRGAAADLKRFHDHLFYFGNQQCQEGRKDADKEESEEPQPDNEESDGSAILRTELAEWTEEHQEKIRVHEADYKMTFAQLECELRNAGNVVMKLHESDSSLAKICQELLDRLSCTGGLRRESISRTRVIRVTHICSRATELDKRWTSCPEKGSPDVQSSQILGLNSGALEDWDSLFLLLSNSSRDLEYGPWPLFELGHPEMFAQKPLIVANCLSLADKSWLRRTRQKPRRLADLRRLAPIIRLAPDSILHPCEKIRDDRQFACRSYRLSGPQPELHFLVEFTYVYEGDGPPCSTRETRTWKTEVRSPGVATHPVLDETLLSRCVPVSIDNLRRRTEKTKQSKSPKKVLTNPNWRSLTHINLSGCGIKVLGELPLLPSVVDLNLSYNLLGSLGSLYAFPSLRSLNLSFNNFVSLVNMRDLPSLENLDVSWNYIRELLSVLRCLCTFASGVRSLQVSHNPVEDVLDIGHGRHLAGKYLPGLELLDGHPIRRTHSVLGRPGPSFGQHPNHRPSSISRGMELSLRWKADSEMEEAGGSLLPDKYTLCAADMGITVVANPELWLSSMRWVDLSGNLLNEGVIATLLGAMPHLEQLCLAKNTLEGLPQAAFQNCPKLKQLDLSRNYLQNFNSICQFLPQLKFLDLSGNYIQSLSGMEVLDNVVELYLSNNKIKELEDLRPLKGIKDLAVLDLTGNDVSCQEHFKKFVVYHLRKLENINGEVVVEGDVVAASETFGGCLDRDALLIHYEWENLSHLVELTLPRANIKRVSLPGCQLPCLRALDLQYNNISSLLGMHDLPQLTVLNLGHNLVKEFGIIEETLDGQSVAFPSLHTLHLQGNRLTNLDSLQLHLLTSLRILFLHQNHLSNVDSLGCTRLTGLVLDHNSLTDAGLMSAAKEGLLVDVTDLHLEANQLHSLSFLEHANRLVRLFIAKNKISVDTELNCLQFLPHLEELSLLGNAVCKRNQHYAKMKELLPNLCLLDGHPLEYEVIRVSSSANDPGDNNSTYFHSESAYF